MTASSDVLAQSADLACIRQLLEDFRTASARASASEATPTQNFFERYERLLSGFRSAFELWRQSQKQTADDFNLLDVMQITGRETMHSGVLS